MSVLDNFSQWKDFLNERMQQGQRMGLDEETITKYASEVGDYLAQRIEPQTEEERLLKDLWEVGNEQEQRTVASLMMKLVQRQ